MATSTTQIHMIIKLKVQVAPTPTSNSEILEKILVKRELGMNLGGKACPLEVRPEIRARTIKG